MSESIELSDIDFEMTIRLLMILKIILQMTTLGMMKRLTED